MLKLVVLTCVVATAAAGALAPLATPNGPNSTEPTTPKSGQPANILPSGQPNNTATSGYPDIVIPGVPSHLLTPNGTVDWDRVTEALSNVYFRKKRSAPLIPPLSRVADAPPLAYSGPVFGSRLAVAPISYTAPITD